MKVRLLSATLDKGLKLARAAVATKSTLPILSNYLLMTTPTGLLITATNRDVSISVWLKGEALESGSITLPAHLLGDFVSSLPPEMLTITKTKNEGALLECGRYRANLKGLDADDFPLITIDHGRKNATVKLDADTLQRAIDQVSTFASREDAKPTLAGVKMTFSVGSLHLAATDGYRLACRRLDAEECGIDHSLIIEAGTLRELSKLFKEAAPDALVEIEIEGGGGQASFVFAGRGEVLTLQLMTSVVDGRYPDYQAIIPKSKDMRCTLDVEALRRALGVARLFARESSNMVTFVAAKGETTMGVAQSTLSLLAAASEYGDNEGSVDLVEYEGEDRQIVFDIRFLIEMLANFPAGQVVMELTAATRPGLFYPKGVDPSDHLYVIMPMHPPR